MTRENMGRFIYYTDEGHGVELPTLQDTLDVVVDIMHACRGEMDDFIEIHCGNGMYQGYFMLVKFGLEHAMSMINKITPTRDDPPVDVMIKEPKEANG